MEIMIIFCILSVFVLIPRPIFIKTLSVTQDRKFILFSVKESYLIIELIFQNRNKIDFQITVLSFNLSHSTLIKSGKLKHIYEIKSIEFSGEQLKNH